MNEQLKAFARQTLKNDLSKLPLEWQKKFKLMYAIPGVPWDKRKVDDILALTIEEVVDAMPEDKLDWAMQQVANSIKKSAPRGVIVPSQVQTWNFKNSG